MKILILFIFIVIQIQSRKLIFVQNLFRHGARYPIFINKDDFTDQPKIANNAGQLTLQGKNMHYLLGKILHKKYWKDLFQGTQGQHKIDHSQIYIKSTNVNRTIQSVQSQLRGWLENLTPLTLKPQNFNYSLPAFENLENYVNLSYSKSQFPVYNQLPKYQPIPIHVGNGGEDSSSSNPYDQGDFLLKYSSLNCPKQAQWQQQNYNTDMAKFIMDLPQVKQALNALSDTFPNQQVSIKNAYKYIDNYVCMQYLGEPYLKIFQNPKYQKAFRYIKEISLFLNLFYQPIQYQTTGTNLFENMVENIRRVIDGKGPKLILYSAHDTTVALTLAVFNLTNINCINQYYLKNVSNQQYCASDYPRFASNFIIQVYKEDNGTYTFDIVFNNIQRKIPFCDYQFSCSVEKFYSWVDSWKVLDPNKQCGIQDQFKVLLQKEKKSRSNYLIAIAVLGVVAIIQAVWIWKRCIKDKKEQKTKQGYVVNFEQKDIDNKPNQLSGNNQLK